MAYFLTFRLTLLSSFIDYLFNHHGAEIPEILMLERNTIKLFIPFGIRKKQTLSSR